MLAPEQRLTILRLKLQMQQEQLKADSRNKHVKKCVERTEAEIAQLEAEFGEDRSGQ
jgi:hypothetical protein